MGVCNCSMFCCMLLYFNSSIAIILMGKRELVASLNLSTWCLVMVEWLFLAVPWGCLRFVIVVFTDHTHLLFWAFQFWWEFCQELRVTIVQVTEGMSVSIQCQHMSSGKNVMLTKGAPIIFHLADYIL